MKSTAGGTARYRVVIRWSEKIPVLELKKFAHLGPAKKHAALHAGNAEGPAWIQELHGSEWRDIEEAANAARTNPKPRLGRPPKDSDAAYSRAIRAQLRPDTDDALRELAGEKQQGLSEYVRRVLESHVRSVQAGRAASKQNQGEQS